MHTNTLSILVLVATVGCTSTRDESPGGDAATAGDNNAIYVAVEEDGTLAELDAETGELARAIDLSQELHGELTMFDVHNAQAAPDGRTVWVTAMPMTEGGHASAEPMPEQLIGVDTTTGKVRARIELGEDLHVAHVVLGDGIAYVTAYDADSVLVVDLEAKEVVRAIALPAGTSPHGARLSADGDTLVVAGMGDGSMHLIETKADQVTSYDLPGRAVQAAILPDGSAAFVTVYDTRQIARLELATKKLSLFDLPAGAAGPLQLYPTSNGRLWIADQGMVDGDPPGDKLYRMNADDGSIERSVKVAQAPHGVVVCPDDGTVWTTTLVDGTVQAIDADSGEVLYTTAVGNAPNGITCVHAGAAMP